jgi:hypothetical protein
LSTSETFTKKSGMRRILLNSHQYFTSAVLPQRKYLKQGFLRVALRVF